jgi:exopolysaccharide production protein ExoQ
MKRKPIQEVFLKRLNWQLLVVLLLMIACFFTWSENILITRVIKVVGRMSGLLTAFWVSRQILKYGAVDSTKFKNHLSPLMYLVYLVLGFVSFLWSTNVGYSALQWFMTAQTFLFCYFFIKSIFILDQYFEGHTTRLFNLLGNSVFILTSIFVVGMWVNPDVFFRMTHGGEEARLGGFMMNPNELGMLAGVGIASFMFDLKRNHRKWNTVFKMLVLFYALYATGSRSSLIGALLIIGYHIKQSSNVKLKTLAIVLGILITPVAVNKIILKDGDTSRMEEVMSMTGRLPFWKALINEGLPREPLLGFGFMRIDYKEYFQSKHTYPGKMTHNTFMQVLMNLGLIGLIIVVFQMVFTFRGVALEQEEKKQMLITLFIPLFINSLTEFGIFGESNYGILFYQLIIFSVAFAPRTNLTRIERLYLKKHRPDLKLG